MIQECSQVGCENGAVGRTVTTSEGASARLVCAPCMLLLMRDGVAVEQLEPRLGLVARVKEAISAGHYDESTFEGELALNLAADKLVERQRQVNALPKCEWDGHVCSLRSCREGQCFMDKRYEALTKQSSTPATCGAESIPGRSDCVLCTLPAGHDGQHMRGWGPSALRWADETTFVCPGCGGTECPRTHCTRGKRTG